MTHNTLRKNERGNVLFLILIAVALFAALSYAVTSSTRSGGGDAGDETNLISSSQVTQYPSSIRTAIVRQIISDNTDPTYLEFNPPSDFTDLTDTDPGTADVKGYGVFHPDGGGAIYALSPPEAMVSNGQGTWYFNPLFEVENIRTTGAGGAGNEIIAFLPGIKRALCYKINEELGIDGDSDTSVANITDDFTDASYIAMMDDATNSGTNFPGSGGSSEVIGDSDAPALSGQPFGCMVDSSTTPDTYIYYHVLVER